MTIKCPYCNNKAVLVDSKIVYARSYGNIWYCEPCKAWVGVHKNSNNKPLGRLANAELREWRKKAHRAFDPLWKTGKYKRNEAYKMMTSKLNISVKDCHIGMFDIEMCKRLINYIT